MTAEAVLRLSVISRRAPTQHDEGATEFGLQNKKKELAPGQPDTGGLLRFDVEVPVVLEDDKPPRFRGPWVHGKSGSKHLYVGWRYPGADGWINRLKVALPTPRDLIDTALAQDAVLETDATGPEWGRLKNWHGLNIGREWVLQQR